MVWRRLRHSVEVEVGTQTQQHDGGQHVVDQVPELGLQVPLPVPEDLVGGWETQRRGDTREKQAWLSMTEHFACVGFCSLTWSWVIKSGCVFGWLV